MIDKMHLFPTELQELAIRKADQARRRFARSLPEQASEDRLQHIWEGVCENVLVGAALRAYLTYPHLAMTALQHLPHWRLRPKLVRKYLCARERVA